MKPDQYRATQRRSITAIEDKTPSLGILRKRTAIRFPISTLC